MLEQLKKVYEITGKFNKLQADNSVPTRRRKNILSLRLFVANKTDTELDFGLIIL
jgi:hypothetical protein